ncbi:hypothetical protein ACWD48_18970 [Streptomyces sp. NPDC002519]
MTISDLAHNRWKRSGTGLAHTTGEGAAATAVFKASRFPRERPSS